MTTPMCSWRFLVPFCLIFFLVHVALVSGQCQDDQRSMLLELKKGLKFNTSLSTKLVTWNESIDCCGWGGVTCVDGRVTGLDLSNESISDGITDSSSRLFDLGYLRSLNLAFNNFMYPQIPRRFGNLTNLIYLNLSNAGFSGQLPAEISHLTRLEVLDFSMLYFPGTTPLKLDNPNFAEFVQSLSELRELRLDGVNISSRDEWCLALSSLLKLEVLSLSNCYLSGPFDCLSKLRYLSDIKLDNNNISTPVHESLAQLSNLTSLRLSSSGLYGTFPEKFFQVPTLQVLDISNNMFLGGVMPKFLQNGSLRTLLLSNTGFSGAVPVSIGYLKMLSRIELMGCSFGGGIPSSVEELTQLVHVDLSMNRFTGPVPSFSKAKNLTQLILAHNKLNGSITSTNWGGLSQLVSLDLRNNSLDGSIPLSLFEITSLQRLQLSQNKFSGQLNPFPNGSSSSLETLDLSSNKLEGQFPLLVFGLPVLKILTLSFNNFSGSIGLKMIRQLPNLSSLDLSYNNLSFDASVIDSSNFSFPQISTLKLASCKLRTFPQFLKDQSRLTSLDLSENQILGELPNWIWNLSSLNYLNLSSNFLVSAEGPPQSSTSNLFVLDLHSNRLQGAIPVLPQFATYLDYSGNNFSSSIPYDIGSHLDVTIFFSLANNNFQGSIPQSVCNAQYLQILDLSNNSLSGKIPECLTAKVRSLVVLNLQRNNFSGGIPNTFHRNCSLKTLDLNGNLLNRQVPPTLANCTNLEVLNLGNNQLSDKFPCWLKKISSLRVLILRSNNFFGSIECPEHDGNWTTLQIVDLASNNFSGNLPEQCLKTWQAMRNVDTEAQEKLRHLGYEVLQFSQLYYQDAVTVTSKGMEVELLKILTVFTSIDFSRNKFEGQIPEVIGSFRALVFLNLSHNALTGQIPTSLGNLEQLESLDLSQNELNGTIPVEFVGLSFLSFLNLSSNQLVGRIPTSTQLQSFQAASFLDNAGLCGPPLSEMCTNSNKLPPEESENNQYSKVNINWKFIFTGSGFGVGAALAILPLVLWKQGRKWCDDSIDHLLAMVFPILGLSYDRVEESDESFDDYTDDISDHDKDANEDQIIKGPYCIFCSKLDITRNHVIHDPKCMCHLSLSVSFSFPFSNSS